MSQGWAEGRELAVMEGLAENLRFAAVEKLMNS